MNRLVSFDLCTLSDEELVKKVDSMTDDMYLSQKVPPRHIPARPDADYDLLVGELCKRFLQRINQEEKIIKFTLLRDFLISGLSVKKFAQIKGRKIGTLGADLREECDMLYKSVHSGNHTPIKRRGDISSIRRQRENWIKWINIVNETEQ